MMNDELRTGIQYKAVSDPVIEDFMLRLVIENAVANIEYGVFVGDVDTQTIHLITWDALENEEDEFDNKKRVE